MPFQGAGLKDPLELQVARIPGLYGRQRDCGAGSRARPSSSASSAAPCSLVECARTTRSATVLRDSEAVRKAGAPGPEAPRTEGETHRCAQSSTATSWIGRAILIRRNCPLTSRRSRAEKVPGDFRMWNQDDSQKDKFKPVQPVETSAASKPKPGDSAEMKTAQFGRSICVKGEITGSEDLTVDGQVDGRIDLPNHVLTVGPNATICADIVAKSVMIFGTILGSVTANERIEVRRSGSVKATSRAPAWWCRTGRFCPARSKREANAGRGRPRPKARRRLWRPSPDRALHARWRGPPSHRALRELPTFNSQLPTDSAFGKGRRLGVGSEIAGVCCMMA